MANQWVVQMAGYLVAPTAGHLVPMTVANLVDSWVDVTALLPAVHLAVCWAGSMENLWVAQKAECLDALTAGKLVAKMAATQVEQTADLRGDPQVVLTERSMVEWLDRLQAGLTAPDWVVTTVG